MREELLQSEPQTAEPEGLARSGGGRESAISPERKLHGGMAGRRDSRQAPSAPPRDGNEGGLNRSFAELRTHAGTEDSDEARAAVTRALVETLAAQFGLRAGAISVRVNGTARADTARRSAHGIASRQVVSLDPVSYNPRSRAGRYLIAHEIAHLAQQTLPASALPAGGKGRQAWAETEANAQAERFTATGTVTRVRAALSSDIAAADADFDAKFQSLYETVESSYGAEIAEIIRLLSYGVFDWAITDGDVEDVLRILAMFPMIAGRAIAHAIGAKFRRRLIDNLSNSHYSHRSEILAVAWARESKEEWEGLDHKLLAPLKLYDVDPVEAVAITFVDDHLSKGAREELRADATRAMRIAEIREFATGEKAARALDQSFDEVQEEIEARKEAEAEARKALTDKLKELARDIQETLGQVIVRDADALRLLDRIVAECLNVRDPSVKIRALVSQIKPGELDELIEQIPVEGLYVSEKRRQALVYLLSMRAPFKNAAIADKLLKSPWWKFWDTVTSEEAYLAFLFVKSMPARARNAFLEAHGGEQWATILEELPQNIRESEALNFYEGGPGQKDRQSILVQLLEESLWTKEQKPKLEGLIRMARAAGEGEFVFAQSEAHEAYKPEKGLQDIVRKHDLYDPRVDRTSYVEKPLEGHAWHEEGIAGFLGMLGAAIQFLVRSDNVDLDTLAIGGEGLDLAELQDIFGGSFMGAKFQRPTAEEKAEKLNMADARWNMDRGALDLEAPNLALDNLSTYSGDMRVTTGPSTLKGVKLNVRYIPKTKELRSLHLVIAKAALTDVLVVFPESMFTVNEVVVDQLDVTLEAANKWHMDAFKPGAEGKGHWLPNMWNLIMGPASSQLSSSLTGVGFAMELIVNLNSLAMKGITTSGGQYIQSVDVRNFAMHSGGDAAAYERALEQSEGRVKGWLEEERRELKTAASPEEKKRRQDAVARLERQLEKIAAERKARRTSGSVLDIGEVTITGLEGLSRKPITLTQLHGQGKSVTGVLPLVSDSTTLRNILLGKKGSPTLRESEAKDESFTLDIGRVEAEDIKLPGGIPSAEDAKKELEDFLSDSKTNRTKPGYDATRLALEERANKAKRYEELANRGVQNLTPAETEEFGEVRNWLKVFEERRAAVIDRLVLDGASLTVDALGQPGVQADSLLVQNIRSFTPTGDPSLVIQEISGEGVDASAVIKGGVGGLKEWRKNLEEAEASARTLTVKGVQHAGSGLVLEELTLAGKDDQLGLDTFLKRSQDGDTSVGLKSRQVIAKGISVPVYQKLLALERERILAVEEAERTKKEKDRLKTIDAMMADLAAIQETREKAEAVLAKTKDKREREKAAKELESAKQALVDWEKRLVVAKLTIEYLDITISGLGDLLSDDYDFDRAATGLTIEGRPGDQRWFEKAVIEDVRNRTATGSQVVAEKIVIGPVTGKVSRTENGFKLENFGISSVSVSGVSFATGQMTVQSAGETKLADISVDAEVAKTESASELTLNRVSIGSIVADRLKYEDADKIVAVESGELTGVLMENLVVVIPDDEKKKTTVTGALSVEQAKSLVVNATASGYRVNATVNSSAPKQQAAQPKALSVDFAKSGDISVALKGIGVTGDVTELKTGNRVHVVLKSLSGKVIKSGDNYTIEDLKIGNLTLSRLYWDAGGRTIEILDRVTLDDIEIDAQAALRTKPKKGESTGEKDEKEEKELASLVLTRVFVRQIDAKKVKVTIPAVAEDKSKGISASPQKTFELEDAKVLGLKLTGFDVLNTRGKVEVTKSVTVTNLKTTVGEAGKDQLSRATASFKVFGKDAAEPGKGGRELSATLTAKDGTILRIGRVDEVTLTDIASGKFKMGLRGEEMVAGSKIDSAYLKGITTGDILIKDGKVEVSDIEIESLGLSSLHYRGEDNNATLRIATAAVPDKVRIKSVTASFKKVPGPVPGKETEELEELTVAGLEIDKIVGTTVVYEGPVEDPPNPPKTLTITMPEATLLGLSLNKLTKNFTTNLLSIDGKLKSATAEGFTLRLAQTIGKKTKTTELVADLTAGEMRANAVLRTINAGKKDEKTELADGFFELDKIGLRRIRGTFSETGAKDKTLGQKSRFKDELGEGEEPGVDLLGVRYDKSGVTIGSAAGHALVYRDPNIGLTLDIKEAKMPSALTIPPEGAFTLRTAEIKSAYFLIEDVRKLGGGDSEGGSEGSSGDWVKYLDILDHVNGYFNADLYMPIYLFDEPITGDERFLRQKVFPIRLEIEDGKFNYEEAEDEALWTRNDLIVSLEMDGDQLALEAGGYNIFEWTPGDASELKEMNNKLVRLKRIALPDDIRASLGKADEEEDASEKPHVKPGWIEMRDIDANLGLKGKIPIDLGIGKIYLGTDTADAMSDLKLTSESTRKLTWTLGELNAMIEELNLKGSGKVKDAEISIKGVESASLEFVGGKLMEPRKLEGTITQATVKNLTFEPEEKK